MASPIKEKIQQDIITAMKGKEKIRLDALRYIMAALKQKEVDDRIELTDEHVVTILDKLAKQRRESIDQFQKANRQDLVDKETYELGILQFYLPTALTDAEITQLIDRAVTSTGASSIKDMGKVMSLLKPQLQGRADMAKVSDKIKQRLG
jgi:uncharacterized protein